MGGALVVADGRDEHAKGRRPLHDDHGHGHEGENADGRWNAENAARSDEGVGRLVADQVLLRPAEDEGGAPRDAERGERDDDGRKLEQRDDGAIGETNQRAGGNSRKDDQHQRQVGLQREVGRESGDGQDRPDGQVNAAGHDDEGRAHGHDADKRNLPGYAHEVVRREEGRLGQREQNHDGDDRERQHIGSDAFDEH